MQLLKSFELAIEVDPMYHPKLIGRRGEVINKIRTEHDVRIQLPDRNDENQSRIVIVGYENSCESAKEEIMKMVREYVSEDFQDLVEKSKTFFFSRKPIIGFRPSPTQTGCTVTEDG